MTKVFPDAGDNNKMYFVDTQIDPESFARDYITLELAKQDDSYSVRPIFDLASGLETQWFKFGDDGSWFVYVREGDDFMALMQYDRAASNFRLATGSENGLFISTQGVVPAVKRDFDPRTNTMSILTEDGKFV